MIYSLPVSIRACLDAQKISHKVFLNAQWFDTQVPVFLEALSAFGLPVSLFKLLQRSFSCFGSTFQRDGSAAAFHEQLDLQDRLLADDLAGLSRLFDSLIESELVSEDVELDFEALDSDLQSKLAPVQEAVDLSRRSLPCNRTR
jgi:hypothetical protein